MSSDFGSTAPDASTSGSLPSSVTANVWADAPSPRRSAEIADVTRQFDDFDPFKPDASESSASVDVVEPPPTPSKSAPPLPSKRDEQSQAAKATDDLEDDGSQKNESNSASAEEATKGPNTPTKAAKSPAAAAAAAASQSMTPNASSSSLSRGFDTIASAFRRRSITAANAVPGPSSSRPSTPSKPAMLVLDKDETDDMDESEKEAPPAMPTMSVSYSQSGEQRGSSSSGQALNEKGKPEDGHDSQQEQEDDAPQFDFNLFLEQMRSRQADPIAKYLRSFLKEFAKRTWGVNDQIRVINDFLDFIAVKMRENEVWRTLSDREFDNAVEAMEKLVMNRLHHQTFVPALSDAQKATTQTDDLERDHVLLQRIRLFGWVDETHLDLPKHDDNESFIDFAKQELRKVNSYKAPRDKLICILNCCKVIFGLMRHLARDDGADTFIPFLILVVLRSNPPHLISNVAYIQRFRNPERLAGENGYYLSSLTGAISFIETMDSSSLSNITQEEFERRIEQEIQSLPPEADDRPAALPTPASPSKAPRSPLSQSPIRRSESNRSIPAPSPRKPPTLTSSSSFGSLIGAPPVTLAPEGEQQRSVSPAEATRDFFVRSSDNLQKTVSKPLAALGRIFTEMGSDSELVAGVPGPQQALHQQTHPHHHNIHNRPVPIRSRSGASITSPTLGGSQSRRRGYQPSYAPQQPQLPYMTPPPNLDHLHPGQPPREPSYSAGDFLGDEVSAEEVQAAADAQQRASKDAKIETLANIFPGIERETLEIVLSTNNEDVERSIEGLLEMA